MEEQRTVKMGGQAGGRGDEPTVHAGREQPAAVPGPFVRTSLPGADQPTPRPGQAPAWGGAQRADAPTLLISQRPTPVLAWLVVMDGPDGGRIQPLHPETTTVGRAPGNDLLLPDDSCSSQHLKIRIEAPEEGEERFVLIDLGSRNGTYVGSKATYRDPTSRVYRHVLQDGDYLLVGETTLVFKRV